MECLNECEFGNYSQNKLYLLVTLPSPSGPTPDANAIEKTQKAGTNSIMTL